MPTTPSVVWMLERPSASTVTRNAVPRTVAVAAGVRTSYFEFGVSQREHRDQAEQQQRARGTTLRETDRHWRESMAVSFVRAVSDEEIQASDRLYADGVIGAEDRTYRPPVV